MSILKCTAFKMMQLNNIFQFCHPKQEKHEIVKIENRIDCNLS